MKNSGRCAKCDTESVVRVPTPYQGIYLRPGADEVIPASNTKTVTLTRYICTACGFVESWVDSEADRKLIDGSY